MDPSAYPAPTSWILAWWLLESQSSGEVRAEVLGIVRAADSHFEAGLALREWFQERLTLNPGSGRAPFVDIVSNLLTDALSAADWNTVAELIASEAE